VKSTCAAEDLKDVSLAALASRSTRAMLSASVFNSRACLLMCVVCVCKPRCMSALDLLTLSTFLCTCDAVGERVQFPRVLVNVRGMCLQTKMHVGVGPADAFDFPLYAVDLFCHA